MLHELSYRDGDTVRPVIDRAAVNEMYVPYLDSDPDCLPQELLRLGRVRRGAADREP